MPKIPTKYQTCITFLLCLVSIIVVSANPFKSSNATYFNRFKRYHHHHSPSSWGEHYEPQHGLKSFYDVNFNYHDSYNHEHRYQQRKPYTHYGVPNVGTNINEQLTPDYPESTGQYPSQYTPQYDGQFTHAHRQGWHDFPSHQHYIPYDNKPIGRPNIPGPNIFPPPNPQENSNPPWQNNEQPNVPNTGFTGKPNSPNENINTGFRPTPQSPIADRLLGLSPPTRGDQLGAFINSKIFGTDFNPNITIGPTGLLLQNDIDKDTVSRAYSVTISCDQPYETPQMPDFRAEGRRISDVRCYEFIWQLRVRYDRESWNQQCNTNNNARSQRSANVTNRIKRQYLTNVFAFVGGLAAAPEEFPHMAALGWNGVNGDLVFKCGATLISANFLLTAAHCTSSAPDPTLSDLVPRIARIGGVNIGYKPNGQAFSDSRRRRRQASNPDQLDVGIINIIRHEQYDPIRKYFDIALMQLEYSLQFSKNLQPACLWTDINSSSRIRKAVGTGWGVTSPNSQNQALNLQAGELDIIDVNTCNNLLSSSFGSQFDGVADHQLCAGKLSGGVDACQGDSGGPLQVKIQLPIKTQGSMHTILGIISAGVGCAIPDTPGVYTRVTSFVDWIEARVWS
ncbi:hypothetical protein K1T71_009121 [Dendrolimus kikuchii]|uniref:Uncharacterized protein n=1 Tax=Dendrolimus kikuchii TaxID=765133 RepID=A0ACC1CU64_9NEOP|nr:hypothetical protein K1T71_009121 [Dendrolimus kikuchii]